MKKNEAIKLCDEKIAELKTIIAALKTNGEISKATRGTQLYARGRERRVLHLINALITQCNDDIKFNENDLNTFVLITTLASERAPRVVLEVHAGDSAFELAFGKYKDVKDINNKLVAAAEKAGLKLDTATGKFVEA